MIMNKLPIIPKIIIIRYKIETYVFKVLDNNIEMPMKAASYWIIMLSMSNNLH